ncbi:MAG: glycogen synthase GlgA [Syntrophomonadaceae bacterium]|nr:glycogen synthase GlgA [Syntrophomonadaceae bacterium]
MDVLFIAAEAWPFAKTGGLGDVAGSLPAALKARGVNVRVIMPLYSTIAKEYKSQFKLRDEFKVNLSWRSQYCGLKEFQHQGIHYYFIDNEYYFKRDRLYGYGDDDERFAFFCRAVLKSLRRMDDFRPDILHCHDWHTALIPFIVRNSYARRAFYFPIKTLFTIHNLYYQGRFGGDVFDRVLGWAGHGDWWEQLEYYGDINYMKGALLTADAISTVSPSYAAEIQTEAYGQGLDGVLRYRSQALSGILNGIDERFFDPALDPALVSWYTEPAGKAENKAALQEEMGLPVQAKTPLLCVVSRLVEPKGIDLLDPILEELLREEVQLAVLGTGEREYENIFKYYAEHYPDNCAFCYNYDEDLAHRIYAGADIILIPSRFEPCGLTQMIAMRYGTVPLVRETGGLKDTVAAYDPADGSGNGFSFKNYNPAELLDTIRGALAVYREQPAAWAALARQAMDSHFDWERSAAAYMGLYKKIVFE